MSIFPPSIPGVDASANGWIDVRRELRWITALAGAVGLSLWAFALLSGFEFGVPITYGDGDSLQIWMYMRRILDAPWFPFASERLGAPFGTSEVDYPEAEALHYVLLKAIGLVADDWVVIANTFILAGFALAACTMYFLLRWLCVRPLLAIAGGVLFAFLPYHFLRLTPYAHVFLASYWNVPIAAWLALRCWPSPKFATPNSDPRGRPWLGLAFGALAVGGAGIYYAFFGCFVILVAGAAAAASTRMVGSARPAAQTILAVCVVVAAQLAPSLAHRATVGPNPEAADRSPVESELTGLKIIQLVLPQPSHPVPAARDLATRYAMSAPLTNENQASSLGLLGSVGLLILAVAAFVRMARGGGPATVTEKLALFAIAAVALGTIGGVGAIFAWTVSPLIRSYNRISIFVGAFSIAALMLLAESAVQHMRDSTFGRPTALALIVAGVVAGGLWDQTRAFDQTRHAREFMADREFIARVEQALPPEAMVYQLPYHPYPETGPAGAMQDYDLLRGYLHSNGLRWSYGAMKGREGDRWLRALSKRPIAEQLDIAAESGFGAVYVDRSAYADRGVALEVVLRERLGPPLATSADGRLVTYRLAPTGKVPVPLERLRIPMSEPIQFADREFPRYVARVEGFSGREPWGRWTDGPVARIRFVQPLPPRFTLALDIARVYGPNRDQPVGVRIGDEERTFTAGGPATVEFAFDLRHPVDTIEFAIPQPASPYSRGESGDRRALGIGLGALHIVPGP